MIIGSHSGWLMLAGMMARPRATSARTNSGVMKAGMRGAEGLAAEVRGGGLRDARGELLAAEVFADGDELHFRGDDALARVVQLRYGFARASRGAAWRWRAGGNRGVAAPGNRFVGCRAAAGRRSAGQDPLGAQERESLLDVAGEVGIAPRAGTVIDTHGRVGFDLAVEGLRRG